MCSSDLDLVVETWVNESMNLLWQSSHWNKCINPGWNQSGPTCESMVQLSDTDLAKLANDPNDTRHSVWINAPSQGPGSNLVLAYDPDGPSGAGFYVATTGSNTPPMPTSELYVPGVNAQLWVNINGSIYISFDGSSWIQKKVLSFDQSTYTATFDPNGDLPYTLDLNREYYINNQGGNYIVKRTGDSAYDVKMELQSVANPVNVATFLSGVSYFKPQWCGSDCSTYSFVTDSGSANFLKLVYLHVGSQDSTKTAGDVVTSGMWGLMAFSSSDADLNQQFNWDYPQNCTNCGGVQQFLMNGSSYVMLDDPIRLAPIQLTNHHGDLKTFSLQFDGSWVSGLPDIFNDLQQNGYVFTAELADKIVAIPSGTEVVDASDSSKHYLFKQIQVNEYLALIADPGGLDLTGANALDLSTLPGYTANGMGAIPNVAVKYSEGVLVQ